jgi:Sec-independent protein translocase protein TatA
MFTRPSGIAFVLVIMLVLAGLMNLSPVSLSSSAPAVAAAQRAQNDSDEDHDNGKGNDDKEKKDKDEKKGKGKGNENAAPVDATRSYTVNVNCVYQSVDDLTTCSFEGLALEDAKKVGQLVAPEEQLCAAVTGNDGMYVDPDPHAHVVGYRSKGSTGKLTLVLSGNVSVSGVATYWIKAGGDVFPVRGPGLVCVPTVAAATATAPSALSDSTGALLVQTYNCPIAESRPDYDWFGACTPAGTESTFRLTPPGGTGSDDSTDATDESGQTQFGNLEPGLYDLARVDKNWCHAESDNVDRDGKVVIKAGERTTVWIFTCNGSGSS